MNSQEPPTEPAKQFSIVATDGTTVPLEWYPANQPRFTSLVLPALGIQSKLYRRLAEGLAAGGCSVLLMEQRGHGRSALRASRQVRFGLADYLDHDIPAALNWLQQQSPPGLPLLLGGHSLGGHLATIYSGMEPGRISGVFHVATGFPYYADFSDRRGWFIRLLCGLVPLFRIYPGYFPGSQIGFAGRESIGVMSDWRDWAITGRMDFGERQDLHDGVANFRGPVLSLGLAQDELSCEAAELRSVSAFTRASITRHRLGLDEQGKNLGHFSWAKAPDGVVHGILKWIGDEVEAGSH